MTNEKIVLGGGCFWCLEAVYQKLHGIHSIISGYAGGHTTEPKYREICNGNTGHAEVIELTFDSDIISLEDILEVFWSAHDPTTLNRQGADVGTQYRSIILYNSEKQRRQAEASKSSVQSNFKNPVVTEIAPLEVFYPAEDYHQNYYKNNPGNPYCQVVIRPKLQKLGLLQG